MSLKLAETDKRGARRVFLRLFEDVSEAINAAVELRVSQGLSQSDIARKMGVDRSFLSRMVHGQAGTNLRSIGALLYATDCRLKLDLVTCEQLKSDRYSPRNRQDFVHTVDNWTFFSGDTQEVTNHSKVVKAHFIASEVSK